MTASLDSVKPGDHVVEMLSGRACHVLTVTRKTKAYITCGHRVFRTRTGFRRGAPHAISHFIRLPHLGEVDELQRARDAEHAATRLVDRLNRHLGGQIKLTLEQLTEAAKALGINL